MARSGENPKPTKPTGFDIIVSGDRLSAKLVKSTKYVPATRGNILAKRRELEITASIDESGVSQFLNGNVPRDGIVVATGKAPVNGRDGELRLNRPPEPTPIVSDDGSIDHRSRSPFFFVNEGQHIGTLILPTLGKRGIDVYGKPVEPKPGVKCKVRPSTNVQRNAKDENVLIAAVDGAVVVTTDFISVETELKINGDVDYTTGNIDFSGDLIVSGDITSGFTVKTGGRLEVKGSILGARRVEAKEIICQGGILGDNSRIVALENITIRFAENANILCYGDITVTNSLVNSKVIAAGSITVDKPGRTIGGITAACENVKLWLAGAPSEVNTVIMAGFDYYRETELDSRQRSLSLIEPEIAKLTGQLNSDDAEDQSEQKKASLRLKALERLSKQSHERIKTIESELATTKDTRIQALCRIEGTIHPGVQVTVGGQTKWFTDESARLEFRNLDGELVSTVIPK